jgi:acetoacetyl-CoA synthetase
MAADYLQEIQARQANGPYCLCGYSFGGLVAFEIARQLSESGYEVGFVGLFDALMSPIRWPPRAWLSIIGRRLARLGGEMHPAPWDKVHAALRDDVPPLGLPSSLPTRVVKVGATALLASARYRPGFYRGPLTLFTPVDREPGLPSLEAIWRRHARTLSVVETSGTHGTMLTAPHADSTAASLTRCLMEALHHR